MTLAKRVVSFRYISTLTMNASVPSDCCKRWLLGVLSAGFPASVINALTCPSPGVSISSARQDAGNSP